MADKRYVNCALFASRIELFCHISVQKNSCKFTAFFRPHLLTRNFLDKSINFFFVNKKNKVYLGQRHLEDNMELFGLGFIFLAFLGIALLVILAKTIKIVPQSSVLLIERLGRFHRVAASGLNIIVPFFESPRAVLLDECASGNDVDRFA